MTACPRVGENLEEALQTAETHLEEKLLFLKQHFKAKKKKKHPKCFFPQSCHETNSWQHLKALMRYLSAVCKKRTNAELSWWSATWVASCKQKGTWEHRAESKPSTTQIHCPNPALTSLPGLELNRSQPHTGGAWLRISCRRWGYKTPTCNCL